MAKIVCDSSSLISLADSCLLNLLPLIDAEFVIPQSVKREIIDDPLNTKRFLLNAMKMQEMVGKGAITVCGQSFEKETRDLLGLANSLFERKGKRIRILQEGEAEGVACMRSIGATLFMCDERTMRELIEEPPRLVNTMQGRLHAELSMDEGVMNRLAQRLSGIRVIRSSEIAAYAYEKGLLTPKDPRALEGALFSLKFSGCAIRNDDIEEYRAHLR